MTQQIGERPGINDKYEGRFHFQEPDFLVTMMGAVSFVERFRSDTTVAINEARALVGLALEEHAGVCGTPQIAEERLALYRRLGGLSVAELTCELEAFLASASLAYVRAKAATLIGATY